MDWAIAYNCDRVTLCEKMLSITATRDLSLYDLETQFNVKLKIAPELLETWLQGQPAIDETEISALRRIQQHYFNLDRRSPLLEDLVKMVVLSPFLDLAGFYDSDLEIRTEEKVEISLDDKETMIRGFIDIVIAQEQFWLLAIETKRTQISSNSALPQILFYLINSPHRDRPTYGLVTNGIEFIFLQLPANSNQCDRSYTLSLEKEAEIGQVLQSLKYLRSQLQTQV